VRFKHTADQGGNRNVGFGKIAAVPILEWTDRHEIA
jgi:hypothetical protein